MQYGGGTLARTWEIGIRGVPKPEQAKKLLEMARAMSFQYGRSEAHAASAAWRGCSTSAAESGEHGYCPVRNDRKSIRWISPNRHPSGADRSIHEGEHPRWRRSRSERRRRDQGGAKRTKDAHPRGRALPEPTFP